MASVAPLNLLTLANQKAEQGAGHGTICYGHFVTPQTGNTDRRLPLRANHEP